MAGVFLSYSHADAAVALYTDRALTDAGYHVFRDWNRDTGIPAGTPWAKELFEALDRVDVVVFLASPESMGSPWCHTEVAVGVARGKHVVQVGIAEVGIHPVLTERQALLPEPTLAGTITRLLVELVRAGFPPAHTGSWDPARSPFPGLRQIPDDFAPVFFGRDAEIAVVVDRVSAPRAAPVLVVGASGCGKSSLLRAGVMPRLGRRTEMVALPVVEPGSNPTTRFALALAELDPRLDAASVVGDPRGIANAVDRLTTRGQRLVVCIDQAEDLLTGVDRGHAVEFVSRVAAVDPARMSLIVALRSASMEAWGREDGFSGLSPNDPVWVRPLDRSNLRQVIVGPARAAGIRIEPPELVEEILDDVGDGRALPLLAALLEELAEGHTRARPVVIDRDRYAEVGPVERIIERRAASAVQELGTGAGMTQAQVVDAYARLADVDEDRQVTRTEVPVESLPRVRVAFEVFERNRLVVRDRRPPATGAVDGEQVEVVTATHEVVFRAWVALADAIRARTTDLELRSRLRREAEEWDRAGGGIVGLTGGRLAQALEWRRRHPDETTRGVARLLDAAARQRRRRRAQTVIAPVLAAAVVLVAVVALTLYRQVGAVTAAQRTTEAVRLASEAQSVAATRPDLSLLLALEAVARGGDPRADQAPFVALTRGPGPRAYRTTPQRPKHGGVSADGTRAVVVGDKGVSDWDVTTGRVTWSTDLRFGAAALSADGSTVALADRDAVTVRPWGEGGAGRRCEVDGPPPEVVRLSDDGALLVTILVDRTGPVTSTILAGRAGSCTPEARLELAGQVTDVAVQPGGRVAAVSLTLGADPAPSTESAGVAVVDLTTGQVVSRLQGSSPTSTAVAVSGSEVAALDADGVLRVWRLPGVTPVWQVRAFDGSRKAGKAVRPLPSRSGAAGSSNSRWLAAASDGTLRTLTTGSDVLPPPLESLPPLGDTAPPTPVALATRSGEAVVLDVTGRLLTWSFDDPTAFGTGVLADRRVDHVAALADGSLLAATPDGTWVVDRAGALTRLGDLEGGGLLAAGGTGWAVGQPSGEVVVGTWPSSGPPQTVGRLRTAAVGIAVVELGPDRGGAASTVVVERDGQVTVFDRGTRSTMAAGGVLGSTVTGAAAHGRWLYLTLKAGRLAVLDLSASPMPSGRAPAETVRIYDAHQPQVASAIAISSDGTLLATGGDDRRIVVWNVEDGVPRPRPALVGHGDRLLALAFSPNGGELASTSEDRTLMRWDTERGEQVAEAVGLGDIADVAYRADDEPALAVASRGVASLPLSWRTWVEVACRALGGRTLTDTEVRQILGTSTPEARCPSS